MNMHKFKEGKGKAFSYFSIVAKNYLILHNNKNYKSYKQKKDVASLEYGDNILEIHKDALSKDDRVVIVDDLLATGGTVAASVQLCQRIGASVLGGIFLIELDGLNGSENSGIETHALLNYPA